MCTWYRNYFLELGAGGAEEKWELDAELKKEAVKMDVLKEVESRLGQRPKVFQNEENEKGMERGKGDGEEDGLGNEQQLMVS